MVILRAVVFAAEAHKNHRRKGLDEPYVNHVLRVGESARQCMLSADAIVAGILHDTVEDHYITGVTWQHLMDAPFSLTQIYLVRCLTKTWRDGSETAQQVKDYYDQILSSEEAIEIKLLDRADNMNDFARLALKTDRTRGQRNWCMKYQAKTERDIMPLWAMSRNTLVKAAFRESYERLDAANAEWREERAKEKQ